MLYGKKKANEDTVCLRLQEGGGRGLEQPHSSLYKNKPFYMLAEEENHSKAESEKGRPNFVKNEPKLTHQRLPERGGGLRQTHRETKGKGGGHLASLSEMGHLRKKEMYPRGRTIQGPRTKS